MNQFRLLDQRIDPTELAQALDSDHAGAFVSFEGRVRNHNSGRAVQRLAYQAFDALAQAEGERIVAEAAGLFAVDHVACAHRTGLLEIGDVAVWVGVSAAHRDAAFACCRHVIDEIKRHVPIWKNEHYADGESGWLHPDNSPAGSAKD